MISAVSDWPSLSGDEKLAFWTESGRLLTDLVEICSPYLRADQRAIANELIDHNEHQLALEFLFDYLDVRGTHYPTELLDQFRYWARGFTSPASARSTGWARSCNKIALHLSRRCFAVKQS